MACVRVSAEMVTEEGNEVKEDEEVEADVVEGADSPLIDGVGTYRSNEAETLFNILRGMFQEETKTTSWGRNFVESTRMEKNRS